MKELITVEKDYNQLYLTNDQNNMQEALKSESPLTEFQSYADITFSVNDFKTLKDGIKHVYIFYGHSYF